MKMAWLFAVLAGCLLLGCQAAGAPGPETAPATTGVSGLEGVTIVAKGME